MIRIITDGACSGNPGPGGWAALIVRGDEIEEIGGHEPETTNNRMEMQAAIEGLRRVPPDEPVKIVTDSQYLLKGMTEWLARWKRRGWRTASGKPVENRDLWEELDRLAGDRVTWEHVRGHSGHPENERVNALAQAYASGKGLTASPVPHILYEPKGQYRAALGEHRVQRPSGVTYLSLVNGILARHTTWEECRRRTHGVPGARYKKCRSLEEEIAAVTRWGLTPDSLATLESPPQGQGSQARDGDQPSFPDQAIAQRIKRPQGVTYLSLVNGQVARHTTWEQCQTRVHGVSGARFRKCKSIHDEIATVTQWGLSPEALLSVLTPSTDEPAKTDTPHAWWFPRRFLLEAERLLTQAGFMPEPITHPDARFRLRRGRAIIEAYVSGKVQRQGRWTDSDVEAWRKLLQAEEAWLDAQLTVIEQPSIGSPQWDRETCGYLWALLISHRLPGWSGEQIGRYLLVRDETQTKPIGVLTPEAWRIAPEEDLEGKIWAALINARRHPDRWCASYTQDGDGNLCIAILALTPQAQFLATAWDWSNVRGISPYESEHVLSRVRKHAILQVARWTGDEWRQEAQKLGNQLDFLYRWLCEAVAQNAGQLSLPVTWPLELIMKPSGNEEWARRLTEQRTAGRVRFRSPCLPEEQQGVALAHFIAHTNSNHR